MLEEAQELDTNNEGDQKEERKEESLEQDSCIGRPIIDLRCEDSHGIKDIPLLNIDTSPYENKILLLKKYIDSIALEVERVKSMSSSSEKSGELSLVRYECNHISSLLKNIIPYIALSTSPY